MVVPIAIPLHAPETKSTFLPLLHDYFHYLEIGKGKFKNCKLEYSSENLVQNIDTKG